jgi:autotransporter-associated beta strand protein
MSLKTVYVLLSLFAWASLATADSSVLFPSKTNTLIQIASPISPQLSNGLGDIYVGRTNQDGQGPATISIRRGLIAFDIADSIPAGATITAVTLTVDDVRGLNGNQIVSLSQMYRDWGQGTSYFNGGAGAPASNGDATWYYTFYNAGNPAASPTWTTPGGQPGVDYSASASATSLIIADGASQTFSWSSTASPAMLSDVQQWLDSPATNFGWIMLGNESAGQTAKRFGGEDAVAPETPPELTVQYDPPWTWTGSAGSAWTAPGNWTSGSGFPPSGAAIVLGSSQTTGGTVDLLSAAPSVSHLTFEADKTMTITSSAPGGGRLTLDNGGSPAAVVVSGSGQAIGGKVAVVLDSDAWITTSGSSDSLSIAGDVGNGAAAHGIVKDGLGTLVLSGSDSFTGGTSVNAGTLIVASDMALPDGTSLTVGAGAGSIFDASAAGAPAPESQAVAASSTSAVPEPAALALLAVAFCGATVYASWPNTRTPARGFSRSTATRKK